MTINLTRDQTVLRMRHVHTRMEELAGKHRLSRADESESADLEAEFQDCVEHLQRMDKTDQIASAARDGGSGRIQFERGSAGDDYDRDAFREPDSIEDYGRRWGNPWDLRGVQVYGRALPELAGEYRSRALSAIEKSQGTSDNVRQAATTIVERFDDPRSTISRLCLLTSSPAYTRAFAKLSRGEEHLLGADEQRALQQAQHFRAMSLTDNAGGYLVPFFLDPTVIITSDGSRNDIRMAARQVVVTGDNWQGVSSANVSWSWDSEASEVSDDATTFSQPAIPNYTARGFVPISIEASMDEQNVAAEVAKLLANGKDTLESSAFATGTGSGQPTGIITALVASSPTVIVNSASADTFALADVYALHGALPARYRANAGWLANNLIYNKIRQFDTAGGAGMWVQLPDGRPTQMISRPVYEAEAVDGTYGSGENYVLVFGDFSNYVITDRLGLTVEFIPHLFHTSNNRPSGQRGWFAYYRTGADSVNDGAFRLLDVT